MNTREAEERSNSFLQDIYEPSEAGNITDWLMEWITGQNRSLRRQMNAILTPAQLEQLQDAWKRLAGHEPIQYVTAYAWFYGMQLYVDRSVLIPRPETEELVDWIVKDVQASHANLTNRKTLQADRTTEMKILDIGTGSGCIALALKKALPLAEVWGCDKSEEALAVARRNGAALNIRVDFQGTDILDEAQQKGLPTVDIIVSNPPYIPQNDSASMQPNVLEYEPHTALFVPNNDPLLFYKAMADFARHRLYEDGTLYFEIHEHLATPVRELFESRGYQNVEVRRDMQGKERMVRVRKI